MEPAKKFGLIMPKKSDTLKKKVNSIFGSDSDDEAPKSKYKKPVIPQKKISLKNKIKEEALDPSIFEYDNIYDEMKAKQAESIAPKVKQNSRYIDTLMKAADKRKKEYERRVERKIQTEREKEGDEFKDKEEFVTAAYKKKMLEREAEEEKERREAMLNDMMDVTKQKDLSGFYRHFLKQTVGEEKVPVFGEKDIKQEVVSDEEKLPNKDSVRSEENLSKTPELSSETASRSTKRKNSDANKADTAPNKKISVADHFDKDGKSIDIDVNKTDTEHNHKQFMSDDIDRDSDNIEIDSDSNESDCSENEYKKSLKLYPSKSKKQDMQKKNEKNLEKRAIKRSLSDDGDTEISQKKSSSVKERSKKLSGSNSNQSDSNGEDSPRKNKHRRKKDTSKHKSYYRKSKCSSSESENQPEELEKSHDHINTKERRQSDLKAKKHHRHDSDSSDDSIEVDETVKNKENLGKDSTTGTKERKNIYAKRTVGDAFIQAQARYFQRMAA